MYRWIKVAFPILALLISAVVTLPTPALADKGHVYKVTGEAGSAVTWASITTAGNHKGTSLNPDPELVPVTVTLTFADVLLPTSHPTFACGPRDPVGSPAEQKLDGDLDPGAGIIGDHEWAFHHMFIHKGQVEIRFQFRIPCDLDPKPGDDSFDYFELHIIFTDPTEKDGPATYDSDDAFISLIHFAEKVNLNRPPGPKRTSHNGHNPFYAGSGFSMTVDVANA